MRFWTGVACGTFIGVSLALFFGSGYVIWRARRIVWTG